MIFKSLYLINKKEFQIYWLQYFKNICFILLQNDEFKCNGNNDSNLYV